MIGWIEPPITGNACCMTDQPITDSPAPMPDAAPARQAVVWPDAARALVELAAARLGHLRLQVAQIHELNRKSSAGGRQPDQALPGDAAMVARVTYTVPRVAFRLPWRSDCLIQAMAAQRWLRTKDIATAIVIGVAKPEGGEFAAHAWLQYGDRIVTGGEVSHFKVLLETAQVPK